MSTPYDQYPPSASEGPPAGSPYPSSPAAPYPPTPVSPYAQAPAHPYAQAPTDPHAQAPTDPYAQAPISPYAQAPAYPYAPVPGYPNAPGGAPDWSYAHQQAYYPKGGTTNGFAIAALVLGILGVSLLAVVFAGVAESQIKRNHQQGRGMAIAGAVLGVAWFALGLVLAISGALGS